MNERFIKNEQYNLIKRQVDLIKDSYKKNTDPSVIMAVRELAIAQILELFPHAAKEQVEMLDLSRWKTDAELDKYVQELTRCIIPFPKLTEQEVKKMFPKAKKLKVPDLSTGDFEKMTYLSWTDISTNKKFIIYDLNEKLMGIECKYSILNKDNICSFCNRFGKVAFISTITKAKKSNNPDYYKAIGNYICLDSAECNRRITSVDYLTAFLKESIRKHA
ncbi:fibronectin-binding family protein [Neobacillus bataviensis LMG 21833]|uniref:Fibronectin-binding family protein n=1 Tax=Neobacillus bataviensis LMG 21833 TaxID=1117379 RepID=K6CI91_9BACI|nr:elongation factor G-binding protein [Neobacillus bataviensis]EKN70880.1 fibronectin-binding family protein [Neobacillus bataviensis LMG 21833]